LGGGREGKNAIAQSAKRKVRGSTNARSGKARKASGERSEKCTHDQNEPAWLCRGIKLLQKETGSFQIMEVPSFFQRPCRRATESRRRPKKTKGSYWEKTGFRWVGSETEKEGGEKKRGEESGCVLSGGERMNGPGGKRLGRPIQSEEGRGGQDVPGREARQQSCQNGKVTELLD